VRGRAGTARFGASAPERRKRKKKSRRERAQPFHFSRTLRTQ
jgi:hypothetical protein